MPRVPFGVGVGAVRRPTPAKGVDTARLWAELERRQRADDRAVTPRPRVSTTRTVGSVTIVEASDASSIGTTNLVPSGASGTWVVHAVAEADSSGTAAGALTLSLGGTPVGGGAAEGLDVRRDGEAGTYGPFTVTASFVFAAGPTVPYAQVSWVGAALTGGGVTLRSRAYQL